MQTGTMTVVQAITTIKAMAYIMIQSQAFTILMLYVWIFNWTLKFFPFFLL